MPNYVYNNLKIIAEPSTLDRIISELCGENGCIDFDRILPIDRSAHQVPVFQLDGQRPYTAECIEIGEITPLPEGVKPLTDEAGAVQIGTCFDWYGAQTSIWGVKWNAGDSDIFRVSPDEAIITFSTAWSSPLPVIDAIGRKYGALAEDICYYATEESNAFFVHGRTDGHGNFNLRSYDSEEILTGRLRAAAVALWLDDNGRDPARYDLARLAEECAFDVEPGDGVFEDGFDGVQVMVSCGPDDPDEFLA